MPWMTWNTSTLLHFSASYGYPAVALLIVVGSAGLPLPLGLLLAALGALSVVAGFPSLPLLIGVGIGASVLGDLLDYALGRLGLTRVGGRLIAARRQRARAMLARTSAFLRRHLGLFIFVTRFTPVLTALASPISVVAGASAMSLGVFWLWDLAGETVFTAGNVLLGRCFGTALTTPSLLVPGLVALAAALLLALLVLPRLQRRFSAGTFTTEGTKATEGTEGIRVLTTGTEDTEKMTA